ncbi:MAG: biopolymer transporter ExbD [Verrucomicrobia bacterium]|nr:biopolymer transporter ExbD [Verrucomicrobiota bacterium]MDA1087166.1 biopolymer transporter ExbD [Verrucomicrobiota bacterium]
MRFTKDQYEEIRINMDPMIDCIFLLIIFFLATTAFIKLEQDLSINLPTMSEKLKVKEPPPAPVIVNVRFLPGGKAFYHVNNERMSVTALTISLTRAKVRNSEQAVVIRGDKNVKWDHVARVMASCAQAGITKVSATVEVEE